MRRAVFVLWMSSILSLTCASSFADSEENPNLFRIVSRGVTQYGAYLPFCQHQGTVGGALCISNVSIAYALLVGTTAGIEAGPLASTGASIVFEGTILTTAQILADTEDAAAENPSAVPDARMYFLNGEVTTALQESILRLRERFALRSVGFASAVRDESIILAFAAF